MTCPSCGSDLDLSQLACPSCGAVPDTVWGTASVDVDPTAHTVPPAFPAGLERSASPSPTTVSTLAFGSPEQYRDAVGGPSLTSPPAGTPSLTNAWDVSAPPVPAPRRRLRVPVLLLSLALVVVGGGIAAAGTLLGWFGGDKRPSDVMPATCVGYLQVDLDPSLVQKASAWQFLRDLPQVRRAVAAGQPDPGAVLWKILTSGEANPLAPVEYERDVKPWLGDQLGVGLLPRNGRPAVELVVEVTDEARAATTLRDWAAKSEQKVDVTIRDGFALLTRPDDTAALLEGLEAGDLTRNPVFAQDLAAIGEQGVLAGWGDVGGLAALTPGDIATSRAARGRMAFSLTFSADTLTLAGKAFGLAGAGLEGATDLGSLPSSTWAAFGISGAGAALKADYADLEPMFRSWLGETGLDRDDLAALLGSSLAVGIASVGTDPTLSRAPDVGARIVTDDPDRAATALDKLSAAFGGSGFAISHTVAADGSLVVSSSPDYLAELAQPSSKLAGLEQFAKALPEHSGAMASSYVYLKPFGDDPGWSEEEYADFLRSLRSVGTEFVASGPDAGTWSVRVVRS